MKPHFARAARGLAVVMLVVAWAAAAHYTTALVDASSWGALLGLAPFALIAGGFAWRSPRRALLLALLAVAAAALALVWPILAHNVGWMYFVQHAGTNALLCIAFGRTLGDGHVPMCTRIAEITHGRVSAALARYTRQVTVAWTLYFGVTAVASAALFAFGPLAAWSTFANLLTIPLVTTMFAAEYVVRCRVLSREDRGSILDAVRAYRQSSGDAARASAAFSAAER
ncbi:MAG: hypothetical protein ROZ37_05300 [Aromatoleum sp.]|uniref:COG4648 family protein n=1 Tax=Aromatoleum sp. TaxID=2307007 RepID=UPI002895C2B6|nr:hypothetical protein [Aromatoleum sp.]MDT3669736.1 hypothetical protein [Aromatoleum sp.]